MRQRINIADGLLGAQLHLELPHKLALGEGHEGLIHQATPDRRACRGYGGLYASDGAE